MSNSSLTPSAPIASPTPLTVDTAPPSSTTASAQTTAKLKQVGDYLLGPTLGQGSFGKVKLATHIKSNDRVAVKIVDKHNITAVDDVERVYRETFILTQLKHGNIIRLHDVIDTQQSIMLVMEYASGGDLYSYVMSRSRLCEVDAHVLFMQIVNGVEYCHRNRVIHRDLKLENILLDKSRNIKIADFGLSNSIKFLNSTQHNMTNCGTPSYTCPEQIAKLQYTGAGSDIWAMGVILFAMVSGFLPFEASSIPALFKKISKKQYKCPSYLSPQCVDLIDKMLTIDPDKRVTLSEMRTHPWLCMEYTELSMELAEQDQLNPVAQQQIYDARQQCINVGKHKEPVAGKDGEADKVNGVAIDTPVNDNKPSHRMSGKLVPAKPVTTSSGATHSALMSSPQPKISVFDRLTLKSPGPTTTTVAASPINSKTAADKSITIRRGSSNATTTPARTADRSSPRVSHEHDDTDDVLNNSTNLAHSTSPSSAMMKKTLNIRLSTTSITTPVSHAGSKVRKSMLSPSMTNTADSTVPRYMQSTESHNRQHDPASANSLNLTAPSSGSVVMLSPKSSAAAGGKPTITISKSPGGAGFQLPSFMQATAATQQRNAIKPSMNLL